MAESFGSDILCYAGNLAVFNQLQEAMSTSSTYALTQIQSVIELQQKLENSKGGVVIFNIDDTHLSLVEILDVFQLSATSCGLILFSAQTKRHNALEHFKSGANDLVNVEELGLLSLIVERELRASAQRQSNNQANILPKQAPSQSNDTSNAAVPKEEPLVLEEPAPTPAAEIKPEVKPEVTTPTPKPANNARPAMSGAELNSMINALNLALEGNKFQMLFQPLIQLGGDDTEFYEVLLRLPKDDGALMSAGLFMNEPAVPERIKIDIDRWVINKSIRLLSRHIAKGSKTRMFINICSSSLADKELASYIKACIDENNLPTESIIFQFNEEDAGEVLKQAIDFSKSLNDSLIPVSLSRFGMQGDSMDVCKKINPLFVKFNGYFIRNIQNDESIKPRIEGMLKQLKSDYKITIMPMVEDVSAVSTLWKMGTDFVQGFYVQAPQSGISFDLDD